jgi:hypothetical protein
LSLEHFFLMPARSLKFAVRRRLLTALCAVIVLAGCARHPPEPSPGGDRDTWDAIFMQGDRVGYSHVTVHHAAQSGGEVVQVEKFTHSAVRRSDKTLTMDMDFADTETHDGKVLDFRSETSQGPQRVTGRVRGDQAELLTSTRGKTVAGSMPWSADYRGYWAVEQSLLRQPMQPGQQRTVRALAVANQVWQTELTARDYQPVRLLDGSAELLQIDVLMRLSDGKTVMHGAAWTDRGGETLKTRSDMGDMSIETFRTTKEVALANVGPAKFDLGRDTMVKLDRPLPAAHQSRQVRYRVELTGGDPAEAFVVGPSQGVKSTGPHTAEVTVYAIRPGRSGGNPSFPADPPTKADRQPNNFIQSDDPQIIADAKEAAGAETDPWRTAVALEKFVHHALALRDYSEVFPTAADVARTRAGDCKAHAVYLAALARARGIPARMVAGLVYVPSVAAFAFHAWTEVYIDNRWIPIDGTLGQGGIGGGHLTLGHSALEGTGAETGFLAALQVIGRLKIEVLAAE